MSRGAVANWLSEIGNVHVCPRVPPGSLSYANYVWGPQPIRETIPNAARIRSEPF